MSVYEAVLFEFQAVRDMPAFFQVCSRNIALLKGVPAS